jgi:hypothetical protein
MPTEVNDAEAFVKLAEKAESCKIKRLGDIVKIKLKTPQKLYTMKMEKAKADAFIKKLKCQTEEV